MIPHPWPALIIALAAFRLTRLAGWDTIFDQPRDWMLGHAGRFVNDLFSCPFCLSVWVAGLAYGAWLLWPHGSMYAFAPAALSAVVGLTARWLDP